MLVEQSLALGACALLLTRGLARRRTHRAARVARPPEPQPRECLPARRRSRALGVH
jgi:hypothetical protein